MASTILNLNRPLNGSQIGQFYDDYNTMLEAEAAGVASKKRKPIIAGYENNGADRVNYTTLNVDRQITNSTIDGTPWKTSLLANQELRKEQKKIKGQGQGNTGSLLGGGAF